jgi:hypothetical protein
MILCCGVLPFLRCGLHVGCWAVDAEVRIGQLFKALPKAKNQHESASNTGVTSTTTKQETIENLGFNKMQASRFETLAEHPERF